MLHITVANTFDSMEYVINFVTVMKDHSVYAFTGLILNQINRIKKQVSVQGAVVPGLNLTT